MFSKRKGWGARGLAALGAFVVGAGVLMGPAISSAQDRGVVARVELLKGVKGEKAVPAQARVARVGGQGAEAAVGKYLEGTAKILKTDKGTSAQILWNALRGKPGSGPAAAVPGLASLVKLENGAELKSGAQLPVSGDITALIRAASTLDDAGKKQDEKKKDGSKDQKQEVSRDSQGQGQGSLGGGSPAHQNSLATPPQISAPVTKTTTETVATDAYGTTTDGCSPEYDKDKNVMVVLSAPTKNGEKTGACQPSGETLEIKKSYVGCSYDIDTDKGVAMAKDRRYYTYGPNTTYLDDTCQPDESMTYKIEEVAGECTVHPDLTTMVATQYTKLVFQGRENETVVAGDCGKRNGETFDISYSTSECSLRDDFDKGETWVQHRPVYTGADGLKRAIGDCADTETFYNQVKDTSVCDPVADYSNGKLYDQFRIRAVGAPESVKWRTSTCKPNAAATTDLVETGDGCESFHVDYDGYSLGGTRVIRKDTGAEVRGCQEAQVRYEHQRETQGWQYDDAKLQAFPKEAVYIVLPQPAGKTYLEQAVVHSDAQPVAYSYVKQYQKQMGAAYPDGSCDKYMQQELYKVYKRPDGTQYEMDAGAGTPIGPTDGCTSYVPRTWTLSSQSGPNCGGGGSRGHETTSYSRRGTYSATNEVKRDDGTTVATSQGSKSVTCFSKTYSTPGAKRCGALVSSRTENCPSTWTPGQSTLQDWAGSLGWTSSHPTVYQ